MRIIPKSEVANQLVLDVLAKLYKYKTRTKAYEEKYDCSFRQFERKIKTGKKEVPDEWDDYIEWQAFYRLLESLNAKLKDIKNGNFRVA